MSGERADHDQESRGGPTGCSSAHPTVASIRPNGDHDLAGPLEAPAGSSTGPHDDDSFVSGPLGIPSDEVYDHSREGDRQIGVPTSEAGRFRVLRAHAQGGIGKVSVAFDAELRREVALKQIKPERADDAESRGRFVLEAEVTGRLEHPGIVPVYGLGIDDHGRPFYAMRFVRGTSFEEAIRQYHRPDPDSPRSARSRVLELRHCSTGSPTFATRSPTRTAAACSIAT